jgi:ribonucleotide reductase beta subunit family protein with ferritin-like domain
MNEIEILWKRGWNEAWNPLSIDFEEDVKDWNKFNGIQKKYLGDLFNHQLFGEYEVLLGVARLIYVIKDEDARFFLATHIRDNTVHANIFERFLKAVKEPYLGERRLSESYYELVYKRPRKILEELEEKYDENKIASFLAMYYLATDGILYNTSYIALNELIFSRNLLKNLAKAYSIINVDEKRQTMFAAYYIKRLANKNKEIIKTVEETLNECSPLILSTIGYFDELAKSFGRNIEEFASLSQGVIDEELKIIGLK